MSTIVTRAGKGSPLTNNEVDANFVNLNTDKIESITSADGSVVITPTGTARDLSVAISDSTTNVVVLVRNTTGATLTKGTAVYISGATGQNPTVSKALATSDATSAQTLGLMSADLANNTNGYVTVIGLITNINTSAYTDGAQLYLSGVTAGTLTATKPYAPIHLVYAAVVEHAHPTQGKLFVKVQNGYELDELHDVSAQSPTTGQTIVYNSVSGLWEKNTVSLTAGVNGVLPTANGGTNLTSFTSGGVVYASSTSALATGSALTFDNTTNRVILGTSGGLATAYLQVIGNNSATADTRLILAGQGNGGSGRGSTLLFQAGGSNSSVDAVKLLALQESTSATANNASFVVQVADTTSGSLTERFRIDKSGNVGIGATSPAYKLDVRQATNADVYFNLQNLTAGYASALTLAAANSAGASYNALSSYDGTSNQWQIGGFGTANTLAFKTGGSEGMRLTSTGLGIGTSSPTEKLTVAGNIKLGTSGTSYIYGPATTGRSFFSNSDSTAYIGIYGSSYGSSLDSVISFVAGTSNVMTFNASGNLGLGVTPSAWGSTYKAFQVGLSSSLVGISNDTQTHLTTNARFDGTNWIYIGTSPASRYMQDNNVHKWFNAASGSSGTNVTFTQAMTLDASGNLALGTTNPAGYRNRVVASAADADVIRWENSAGTIVGVLGVNTTNGTVSVNAVSSNALVLATANTERMRVTSAGNLALGQTSSTARLTVQTSSFGDASAVSANTAIYAKNFGGSATATRNIFVGNTYTGNASQYADMQLVFLNSNDSSIRGGSIVYTNDLALTFRTGQAGTLSADTLAGTEYLRITSAGNVGIGTTTPNIGVWNKALTLNTATGNAAYEVAVGGTAKGFFAADASNLYIQAFGAIPMVFTVNGSERVRIDSSGNVGIGTSSPTGIGGSYRSLVVVGSAGGALDLSDSSGTTRATISTDNSGGNALFIDTRTSSPIVFRTTSGTAERMRITSAGDVGIGTNSPSKLFDVGSVFRVSVSGNAADITSKSDNTGGLNLYGGSSFNMGAGLLLTGTSAGNANTIIFTRSTFIENARFDASGNLGIGTTSPTYKLVVSNAGANGLEVTPTGTNSGTNLLSYNRSTGSYTTFNYYGTDHRFYYGASATEGLRLDSSGNLLLGTTTNTNSSKLVVNGTISQTVGGTQYLVVDQSDIGTGANEIPLNQYLGSMAYQDGSAYYNTGMTVGFRNRIINGNMAIDQRNNGATVNSGNFVWSVDRWNTYEASSGAFSVQRSTVAPTGFTNSLLFTVTTAQSSITAGDQYIFWQPIEGNNIADLAWGTANAQPITVSFWVRSSVTGTFPLTLISDGTDTCVRTFRILNANTWEYKTITISGATAGTWRTGTDLGMYVRFVLGAGSNYFATEGEWNYSSYKLTTSGCTNLMATSGATFQVTGVQLEKGNIATPFDVRPYGTELQLCQRYFVKYGGSASDSTIGTGFYDATNTISIVLNNPVTLRATPSITFTGTLYVIGNGSLIAMSSPSNIMLQNPNIVRFKATATGVVSNILYNPYSGGATSYIDVSSEL